MKQMFKNIAIAMFTIFVFWAATMVAVTLAQG